MNDRMEPLTQFSKYAGRLCKETVPGVAENKVEYENDVNAASGQDRSLHFYVPESGCPDAKQAQVLMVLRDDSDTASAEALMRELKLDELSEQEHFILLFPDPQEGGWNYDCDPGRDNDMDFLNRCFGILRSSRIGVGGFNGMIFYIGASPSGSAMMLTMSALKPANVSAMMLSELPEGCELPKEALGVETAAWCREGKAAEYLRKANGISEGVTEADCPEGVIIYPGSNPECRLCISELPLSAESVRTAWDRLFSRTRRWQNDTYGHYQYRTKFTERGFTAHVADTSLGVNGGFAHTWFEYVPPKLRGTKERVPLLFYFHGVNCVPLYGAEQSNWHDIAEREGFIVVYPAPARYKAWNIYDHPGLISDFKFVFALIEHIDKEVHPIDRSRIYSTGFSMGGMMTHSLCSAYPDVFAAGAPCNAFASTLFMDPVKLLARFLPDKTEGEIGHVSYSARLAEEKKKVKDYRMPIFQNAGFIDAQIGKWPLDPENDDIAAKTLRYWMDYDHISTEGFYDAASPTGLRAAETFYEDEDKRYVHQRWLDDSGRSMLELVVAARMPHAIDPVQTEYAWEFIKHFARGKDGESIYID